MRPARALLVCPACRELLPPDAQFCPSCDERVDPAATSEAASTDPAAASTAPATAEPAAPRAEPVRTYGLSILIGLSAGAFLVALGERLLSPAMPIERSLRFLEVAAAAGFLLLLAQVLLLRR